MKPFGDLDLGQRVLEIGEVVLERFPVAHRHRPDAHCAARDIHRAGHPLVGSKKIRVVAGVEPRHGRLVAGKAREPVGDIGRVAGL